MEQETINIIVVLIGLLGFIFGVYQHFSTRKSAQVAFNTCQLSDFEVPKEFQEDFKSAPLMLNIESTGNKLAENVIISLRTLSNILNYTVITKEQYEVDVKTQDTVIKVPKLNPGETLKLFLRCQGSITNNQIETIKITHSEGTGIDKKSSAYSRVELNFLLFGFEYDLNTKRVCLVRFGPWRLKPKEKLDQ